MLLLLHKLSSNSVTDLNALQVMWEHYTKSKKQTCSSDRSRNVTGLFFQCVTETWIYASINDPYHCSTDCVHSIQDGWPSPLSMSVSLMASNSSAHLQLRSAWQGEKMTINFIQALSVFSLKSWNVISTCCNAVRSQVSLMELYLIWCWNS